MRRARARAVHDVGDARIGEARDEEARPLGLRIEEGHRTSSMPSAEQTPKRAAMRIATRDCNPQILKN